MKAAVSVAGGIFKNYRPILRTMYLVQNISKNASENGECVHVFLGRCEKVHVPSHILATRLYEWDPRGDPFRVLGPYKGHRLLLL